MMLLFSILLSAARADGDVWDSVPDAVDSSFTDAEIAHFAVLAMSEYRGVLREEISLDEQTVIDALEMNPWHGHFVRATGILLGIDESEVIEKDVLQGLLTRYESGDFDPISFWKAASALENSKEMQAEAAHLVSDGRFTKLGDGNGQVTGGADRRLLAACKACAPWDLDQRKCWCACDNKGQAGASCSAWCKCSGGRVCEAGVHICREKGKEGDPCHATRPCAKGFNCEAGVHKCRSPGEVGDPCHATRPCGGGLNCQPGVHKCYNVPRLHGQPCSAGYECGSGMNCQPGVHKCYNVPRQLGEPCSAGFNCGSGMNCQPGVHKCYHVPRRHGEPCSAGFDCGNGLSCQPGVHKCYHHPRRLHEPCVAGFPCGSGLSCHPAIHKCYHLPRWLGEPCVAGHPCGDGLWCVPGEQKCKAEWISECPKHQPCSTVNKMTGWDVVIVGAGAAGAAAAREFYDGGKKVLLIERGPWDTVISQTQSGNTWPQVVLSSATESFRMKDGTWGAMGKVVGGGTSVNDGLFIEEEDDWFIDAFGYNLDLSIVRAMYKKFGDQLAEPLPNSNWSKAWLNGLKKVGLWWGSDPDTEPPANTVPPASRITSKSNTFRAYSTFDANKRRHGAADLIRGIPLGDTFQVATNTLATKIVFSGTQAVGVATKQFCSCKGASQPAMVFKGAKIVLAAGAFRTPQLLQLSGIGDEGYLTEYGIRVVKDLPEVGQNFIDRNVLSIGTIIDHGKQSKYPGKFLGYSVSNDNGRVYEAVGGDGVASAFADVQVGLLPPKDRSMLMFESSKLLTGATDFYIDESLMIFCLTSNTKSRGSVKLNFGMRGADKPPLAHARYLSDPENHDRDSQRECYKKLKKLNDEVDLGWQRLPAASADSSKNDKIDNWVEKYTMTSYHYFGTAAAGTVVDERTWAVKGVTNLYAIDASIIRRPTSVNPQATIMALGGYFARRVMQEDGVMITPDDRRYRFVVQLGNIGSPSIQNGIRFRVKASNDAHIGLFPGPINTGSSFYEIVLSGWGNTQSVIRRGSQQANLVTVRTVGMLSDTAFRDFVVMQSWDGFVRVFKDNAAMDNLIMEWKDPSPLTIASVGCMTGWGAEGAWNWFIDSRAQLGRRRLSFGNETNVVRAESAIPSRWPVLGFLSSILFAAAVTLSVGAILLCVTAVKGPRAPTVKFGAML